MKNRPVHENLDTAFVNLSALLKYLRRRQFAGRIRIELSGYEADIHLTEENDLKVREYDHIAGRVAEGEQALQRILIRSREPGGIINVYQTLSDAETSAEIPIAAEKQEIVAEKPKAVTAPKPEIAAPKSEIAPEKSQTVHAPLAKIRPVPAPTAAANGADQPKIEFPLDQNGNGIKEAAMPLPEEKPAPKTIFPNVPFEFTNRVEARAKPPALSKEESEMLLDLTGELLGTIDQALQTARLEFSKGFQKACLEIAADYPFLKTLDYEKGKIYCAAAREVNPKFFVAGVLEAVRRVLGKLAAAPKFSETHRLTVQRLLALMHQRRALYDRFSIAKPLEKILGV